jgi:alpha-L-fucosidase
MREVRREAAMDVALKPSVAEGRQGADSEKRPTEVRRSDPEPHFWEIYGSSLGRRALTLGHSSRRRGRDMKNRTIIDIAACFVFSTLFAATAAPLGAQSRTPDRLQWFREAKFGLFIHWGVYSMIGREEWARQLLQIPLREYQYYADNFNPVSFDPDAWAALAKDAGVRYVIITSKHHDGFSMFDSRYTDYDIMKAKYGRDILGLLSASCKRAAIPLGFYYSIMDWHHPDYLPRRAWETDRSAKGADFGRYMDFATNQVKELVTKYDPAVLWFDGEWEHSNEEQRAFAIEKILLGLKPTLLINDRLFKREPGHGDFGTPENYVPATGVRNPDGTPRLWEACYTMNWNGWGYNRYETEFHSASQLIRQLIEIVSKGGNLLLNVGPQPDGRIQADFVARLRRMGEWLRTNGEAIYGTTASVFERLPFFGRCTVKGNTLYVHIMGWPADAKVRLPGLKTKVKRAYLLADPDKALAFRRAAKDVVVGLPERALDPDATVVVVELQGPPEVEPYRIVPETDGRIELPVTLADIQSEMGQRAYLDYFYRTTMLANWQNVNDYPEWVFTTDKPGHYEILASYASMWGGRAAFEVEVDGRKIAALTGSSPSVYLPKTFSVGKISLDAGKHELRVRITALTNNHAMNLEKVVLVPAKKEGSIP